MRQRIIDDVLALQQKHAETWRHEGAVGWLSGLEEEVRELQCALFGVHEHTPEWELRQIASIALNWLDMRADRGFGEYAEGDDGTH